MRVAIGQFNELTTERLRFARQIGASGVLLNTPLLPGESVWDERDLLNLRLRAEEWNLRLEAIENVPIHFYDKAMLGLPGRDEQIENYLAIIRAFGRAGIPVLGYHFMPNGVWRTPPGQGRGGARVTVFDFELARDAPLSHGREYTADEMWSNYTYFIRAVLPVAEESGVTLALHPDDPPVPSLGGVARLFGGLDGFRRAVEAIAPSPNHGLDFCMGCWSEMGPGAVAPMSYFAERGKIVYVHFRDVQGVVPKFAECFLGEGNTDVVAAMLALKRGGFTGFIIDDHVPHLVDDTEWGHRGRAHQTGYIMGLLAAVERLA